MNKEIAELRRQLEEQKLKTEWYSERLREHLSIYTAKEYLGGKKSVHELATQAQLLRKELDRQLLFSPDNLPLIVRLPLKSLIRLYSAGLTGLKEAIWHKIANWNEKNSVASESPTS